MKYNQRLAVCAVLFAMVSVAGITKATNASDGFSLAQQINILEEKVVVNKPARGAHFTSRHLF